MCTGVHVLVVLDKVTAMGLEIYEGQTPMLFIQHAEVADGRTEKYKKHERNAFHRINAALITLSVIRCLCDLKGYNFVEFGPGSYCTWFIFLIVNTRSAYVLVLEAWSKG